MNARTSATRRRSCRQTAYSATVEIGIVDERCGESAGPRRARSRTPRRCRSLPPPPRARPRGSAPRRWRAGRMSAAAIACSSTSRVIEPRSRSTSSWSASAASGARPRLASAWPCRREQHEPVGAQAHGVQARIGDGLGHHRDVGLVAQQPLQHDRRIVDRQREGEAAGALPQRRHDRHDVVRRVGGDPQMAARQRLLARQQRLRLVLRRRTGGVVTPCSWRPVSVGTTVRPRRSNRRTP